MSLSLQVIYPISNGTRFDFDYYLESHMPFLGKQIGEFIQSKVVTKGLAGGPDTPAGIYAIATMVFADQQAFDAAMKAAGPVLADIPNFTDVKPQMLIGEVVA